MADRDKIPREVLRFYELVIVHRPDAYVKTVPVRKVGAKHIGKLIKLQGIVTRVSDV